MYGVIKIIKYQLYLLQLENYDLLRFWHLIKQTQGWPRRPARKPLVWTAKLAAVLLLAVALDLTVAIWLGSFFGWGAGGLLAAGAVFLLLSFVFFMFLMVAVAILSPVDYFLKKILIGAARRKLGRFPNLKIIGITGSYGKTTMKEVLATLLEEQLNVLKTPENINTPLGVARLILKELSAATEVFIVEMGAYRRGDIRALCEIAKPEVAILTGINESHLERFGSLANTIATKFEIVDNAAEDGLVILNGDDPEVLKNYSAHIGKRKAILYGLKNPLGGTFAIKNQHFFEDGSGISFELWQQNESLGNFKVPILGEYILGTILACVIIMKELGLNLRNLRERISWIKPVPHRLEVVPNQNGILVIDDSYNGNPEGVKEAIGVLGKFSGRRKIYVTPGLVEMGNRTREVHLKIGEELGKVADLVMFIKNSVTPVIAEGLMASKFPAAQILWFGSRQAASDALPKILKTGDVVMFQNDWPDNYF